MRAGFWTIFWERSRGSVELAKELNMTTPAELTIIAALIAAGPNAAPKDASLDEPGAAAPVSDTDADEASCREGSDGSRICEFVDDEITGANLSPEGKIVQSRPRGRHSSLIRIRQHFIPELVDLARDL